MGRRDALADLLACLRGEAPHDVEWDGVIALANKTLATPVLATRLMRRASFASLPADVRTLLADVLERNAARNQRLLGQLGEAVACLDADGMRPVLMKGAAIIAAMPSQADGRMLADLDLMVAPDDFGRAIERLVRIGYQVTTPSSDPRVPSVLARNADAATIDLHSEAGGAAVRRPYDEVATQSATVRLGDGRALIPSATIQVMILALHDQLKGRDYLRGMIDLRHLLDIEMLASVPGGIDWARLEALFPAGYARDALEVQLLTAKRLLGVPVPDPLCAGVRPELQYQRRILQARRPWLMAPLTALTMLLDRHYHAARRAALRSKAAPAGPIGLGKGVSAGPRMESLRRLFRSDEIGKV